MLPVMTWEPSPIDHESPPSQTRITRWMAAAAFLICLGSTPAFAQRAGDLISAEPVVETPGEGAAEEPQSVRV